MDSYSRSEDDQIAKPSLVKRISRFFSMLFDFSFSEFITVQMFPVLYGVVLSSTLFALIYLTVEAFLVSIPRGLFYLFLAGPVTFIAIATILRAVMGFYIVVFRIAENVDEMRITAGKLSGITNTMDEVRGITRKIPFWNIMGKSGDEKETDESAAKKKRKSNNWPY